jgi:hypothetical protein
VAKSRSQRTPVTFFTLSGMGRVEGRREGCETKPIQARMSLKPLGELVITISRRKPRGLRPGFAFHFHFRGVLTYYLGGVSCSLSFFFLCFVLV